MRHSSTYCCLSLQTVCFDVCTKCNIYPQFHHTCNEKVILLTLPKDNQMTPTPTTSTIPKCTVHNKHFFTETFTKLRTISKKSEDKTGLSPTQPILETIPQRLCSGLMDERGKHRKITFSCDIVNMMECHFRIFSYFNILQLSETPRKQTLMTTNQSLLLQDFRKYLYNHEHLNFDAFLRN